MSLSRRFAARSTFHSLVDASFGQFAPLSLSSLLSLSRCFFIIDTTAMVLSLVRSFTCYILSSLFRRSNIAFVESTLEGKLDSFSSLQPVEIVEKAFDLHQQDWSRQLRSFSMPECANKIQAASGFLHNSFHCSKQIKEFKCNELAILIGLIWRLQEEILLSWFKKLMAKHTIQSSFFHIKKGKLCQF